MFGAIIGDIVGSRFEWDNNRSKSLDFLVKQCFPTDDIRAQALSFLDERQTGILKAFEAKYPLES